MKKKVIKEIVIFCLIALALTLAIHPDLLYAPYPRVMHMNERENFLHPLVYTAIVYTIILIVRSIIVLIKKLFSINN